MGVMNWTTRAYQTLSKMIDAGGNLDINEGNIDGVPIGSEVATTGAFTTLNAGTMTIATLNYTDAMHATTLDVNATANFDGKAVFNNTPHAILLPQDDSAASPTLAFGDGDTGFYEGSDDNLTVTVGGIPRFYFTFGSSIQSTLRLKSAGGSGPAIEFQTTPTAVIPNILPSELDTNTGLGRAAADQLSLIAGGIEGIRITEALATTGIDIHLKGNVTASNLTATDLNVNTTASITPAGGLRANAPNFSRGSYITLGDGLAIAWGETMWRTAASVASAIASIEDAVAGIVTNASPDPGCMFLNQSATIGIGGCWVRGANAASWHLA